MVATFTLCQQQLLVEQLLVEQHAGRGPDTETDISAISPILADSNVDVDGSRSCSLGSDGLSVDLASVDL